MTGFHYLITLYFLYSYSSRLETGSLFSFLFFANCSNFQTVAFFTFSDSFCVDCSILFIANSAAADTVFSFGPACQS